LVGFCTGAVFAPVRASAGAEAVPSFATGAKPGPLVGVLEACSTVAAEAGGGLSFDAHAAASAPAARIPRYFFMFCSFCSAHFCDAVTRCRVIAESRPTAA